MEREALQDIVKMGTILLISSVHIRTAGAIAALFGATTKGADRRREINTMARNETIGNCRVLTGTREIEFS